MSISEKYIQQVASIWNKKTGIQGRRFWWDSDQIISHMNYHVCGEHLQGWNAGAIKCLKNIHNKYETALSIGCGTASKEMQLLEQGIVDRFICFELSDERIKIGQEQAKIKGLGERIKFYKEDFFISEYANQKYDLVFWDNSLHHMPNTFEAVKMSKDVLKDEGVFFCNDYIGESRFQWPDEKIDYVNNIRMNIPDEIFVTKEKRLRKYVRRPTVERMLETDPSEAADSDNILPAIKTIFKSPSITMLGGVVYLLALDRIIENIPDGSDLMEKLIRADDEAIERGWSLYAFVLAKKNDELII